MDFHEIASNVRRGVTFRRTDWQAGMNKINSFS